MRLPDQPFLSLEHLQFIIRRPDMIDLAILRMGFDQRLPRLADQGPVDRTREDHGVVTAEICVRLFARDDQEVTIGMAAADIEICILFLETQRSRIARVAITVEIGHHRDIDAESPECRNPRWLEIQASGVQRLFMEVGVEMTDRHLETGERFVPVVVSELHYPFLCGRGTLRAEIIVNCHALPGSGWRIIERKISHREAARLPRSPLPHFIRITEWPVHLLAVGLTNTNRERAIVIFAVPHVAQVKLDFAAEEEFVRWREDRDGAASRFDYGKAIARPQCHRVCIGRPAELIFLPATRNVAPDHTLRYLRAESFESGAIVVSHRR